MEADQGVTELYTAHYRGLVRLAVLLVQDTAVAEEVVQDAFVAIHRRWGRLRDTDKALSYIRQAVVNRSRSALRRRGTEQRHAATQRLDIAYEPDPARRLVVLDALKTLPQRQREVIALRYYVDLDEATIATTLGISRGAVKSHAARATATLRQLLEESHD